MQNHRFTTDLTTFGTTDHHRFLQLATTDSVKAYMVASFKPGISLLALSLGAPVYAPIATFDAGSAVNSPSGVPAAGSGDLRFFKKIEAAPLA